MAHNSTKWTGGIISRFAGTGVPGYSGDGGYADTAELNGPAGLAVDRHGNVYVAEIHNNVIRRIDASTNRISTFAGCGRRGFDGDGEAAALASLNGPEGVCLDSSGNLYIADTGNHRIRKVDACTGVIHTIAGTGEAGYNGDCISALDAMLNSPAGVVVDSGGFVFFNDYKNDRVREIHPDGMISTFAGTGVHGYSGDGGPACKARINDVYGLGIDKNDHIFIMDSLNFAVRKINRKTGIISTVLGQGKPGPVTEFSRIEDSFLSGPVHEKGTIGMKAPHAVEVDSEGNLFVGDTGACRIRMADISSGLVYTVAGNGSKGCSGDAAPALDANICVHGLRMDANGNLYFVDFHHHVIRVICF